MCFAIAKPKSGGTAFASCWCCSFSMPDQVGIYIQPFHVARTWMSNSVMFRACSC